MKYIIIAISAITLLSCSKPKECYVCATSTTSVQPDGNSLSLQQTLSEFCGTEAEMLQYQKDNSGHQWTPTNKIWKTECK